MIHIDNFFSRFFLSIYPKEIIDRIFITQTGKLVRLDIDFEFS